MVVETTNHNFKVIGNGFRDKSRKRKTDEALLATIQLRLGFCSYLNFLLAYFIRIHTNHLLSF